MKAKSLKVLVEEFYEQSKGRHDIYSEPPRDTVLAIKVTETQKQLLTFLAGYLKTTKSSLAHSMLISSMYLFVIKLVDQHTDPDERRKFVEMLRDTGLDIELSENGTMISSQPLLEDLEE